MRALSTGASQRGLAPTSRQASACSMPGDRRVEQIAGAPASGSSLRAVLAAVEVGRAQRRHQVLERGHRLGVAQVAGDRRRCASGAAASGLGDRLERLAPARRLQLAVPADIGLVEPLARSPSQTKRVLSEIHSSFTSSLIRGRMRITSRPRASTRMFEPTASITSMVSVLFSSHGRAVKA